MYAKVQKAKLLIPDEQILLNDPIPQRREIREIYEKIYTRIPKVGEAEKEKSKSVTGTNWYVFGL